ncbi:unnamed protein product [Thlaspi arvense]|uniref:Uncharacterized protein n=1 Tax=Thlaspi arvense TaxID=13288 RepID=A0AAU9RVY3_THLAR|nr:unnamed protein product [Thlaspi arvense]
MPYLQSSIMEIHGRLSNLHQEMTAMAQHMMVNMSNFRNKEAETASLKNQLKDLQISLESMIHNQNQADTYFNLLGSMLSERPMYQGISLWLSRALTNPSLPGFLSSDEAFTSRYGTSSVSNFKTKTTRAKPRRQKDSEYLVNPTKRPTLTSSSSHESIEDTKKKERDIGIIEFLVSSLLDTLSKTSSGMATKEQAQAPQVSSSQPIAMINHFSDTSCNSYNDNDDSSDEESLPTQFEMDYTRPIYQEMSSKQFASKVMIFAFYDISFEKWNE